MSAIDFKGDVQRVEDPAGDRVVITFNGKVSRTWPTSTAHADERVPSSFRTSVGERSNAIIQADVAVS